jgi:glycosyltransferase involved in cell wall biosynthesis
MIRSTPRYSLIIPARNGGNYLQVCIQTILSQHQDNFELIISDDNSTDGSKEYLRSLEDPRVQVYFPEPGMSMAEHWEWALTKAKGEWLTFVGQDDGIQGYFFSLADRLTSIASSKGIRAIMSQRAYYFWPGCEFMYGNIAISYSARSCVQIKNSKLEALWALMGFHPYFELPEMYTTSLFHRSLIQEAQNRQGGKLFLAHPQDANLGAIACCLEPRYLHSYIPLGWVGSSPKSAGMAIGASFVSDISAEKSTTVGDVRNDYIKKTNESKIPYHWQAGDFTLASSALYFWGALLQTPMNYSKSLAAFLNSRFFVTLMLAGVCHEIRSSSKINANVRWELFQEVIRRNNGSKLWISLLSRFHPVVFFVWKLLRLAFKIPRIALKKKVKMIRHGEKREWPNFIQNSAKISALIHHKRLLENL